MGWAGVGSVQAQAGWSCCSGSLLSPQPPHKRIPASIICLIPPGTIGFLSDGLILLLRQPFHPLGVQQQEFLQVTFGFVLL